MAERDEAAFERLSADRLAADALAAGDPTGWFEPLYANADAAGAAPPWHIDEARPLLVEWAQAQDLRGDGKKAAVVGAGLGSDAEYLASLGFDTLGFDVSPTAVRIANERSTHANARYEVGDLFDLPSDWRSAFDLVVEIWTVQALPPDVRAASIEAIAALVKPGGRLLAIAWAQTDADAPLRKDPPWPLTRTEFDLFGASPLRPVKIDHVEDFFRGEFAR